VVVLLAAACDQPFTPRAGVPTLDDAGSDDFAAVSAGLEHTCALTTDGTAYCWGSNEFGQLGAASDATCPRDDRGIACQPRPVAVSGGLKFKRISAGGVHTCALALDDRIYCWGDNLRGALGDPGVRGSAAPIAVLGNFPYVDVAAGGQHTCALRPNGAAYCWGSNDMAQLGIGTAGLGSATPDSVRTLVRFASLAAGAQRTCARQGDGGTFCWGATWVITLDDEVLRQQTLPLRVPSSPPFKSLSVGTNTTCGISIESATSADDHAYCWEANPAGGIGDGSIAGSLSPRPVSGAIRFVAVSSGAVQTCGIADTGFAYCWGGGSVGQLGMSTAFLGSRCGGARIPCSTVPVRVSGWRVFSQITAGQGNHACGLTLSGNIYCWGAGGMGQRGEGRASSAEWSPVKIRSPLAL